MSIADDIDPNGNDWVRGVKVGSSSIYLSDYKYAVPLTDIVWIYKKDTSVYGVAAERLLVIMLTQGGMITLSMPDEQVEAFLASAVRRTLNFPPYVIVGYGKEQESKYLELVKRNKR